MKDDHVQRTRYGLSCFSEQASLLVLPSSDAQKAVELAAVYRDPCVIDLLERGLWLTQDTKLRKETRRGRPGIWSYSQQRGRQSMSGCPWMNQAQVQHMQNHPMMGCYMHMGQTHFYSDSPTSITALQNQLGLSGDQIKQLAAIKKNLTRMQSCFDR
jgi:hypothetical protein